MAYTDRESRLVKTALTVTIQGVQVTIPANETIEVIRDKKGESIRVYWSGFPKKQLGLYASVTEKDLDAHS
jgi:hypothetical protein